MDEITGGDRVRVDIPDTTDPDHEFYHGEHRTILATLSDDAGEATGDGRNSILYRVELDNGESADFR